MLSNFDPYWEWLKIPANQQPPNHYRLLGLKPLEADVKKIEAAVDRLVEKMQRLSNGPQVEAAQKILNEVAHARLCFNDPNKKQVYDKQLAARLASQQVGNSATAPQKPQQNNGASHPGKAADSPRKTGPKDGLASPKPSSASNAKSNERNPQVQRMMIATIAMLALGGLAGSLFVWFAVSKSPRPVAEATDHKSNFVATNNNRASELTLQNPITAETAQPKTGSPSKNDPITKDALSQNALSTEASAVAGDSKADNMIANQGTSPTADSTPPSTPASATPAPPPATIAPTTTVAPTPAETTPASTPDENPPAPTNELRTIADMPDTYVPAKSNLFESLVDEVVGLQGQPVSTRTSSSGKTVYLMFSQARDDLIEIRVRAQKVSHESLKPFVGKKIRVRGELKREFGSKIIGLEIDTIEQIEIVE